VANDKAKNKNTPKVDPIIEKLMEKGVTQSVVEFQGYVGPSSQDHVRLYLSRKMTSYIDIPEWDIIHFIDPKDENDSTRVYVVESTKVQFTTFKSKTVSAAEAMIDQSSSCGCSGEPDQSAIQMSAVRKALLETQVGARRLNQQKALARLAVDDDMDDFINRNNCLLKCDGDYLECLDDGVFTKDSCKALWRFCYSLCNWSSSSPGSVSIY
jgi:hypothetical protein